MYKRITQGQILEITGVNLYPENTQVYFNSTGTEAPIVPNSFNSNYTQVSVRVPNYLPRLNSLIVYNGINYHTGTLQYEFVGMPTIESLSDDSLYWGESTLVGGSYLAEITGASIGDVNCDFYVESPRKVEVTCPQGITTGQRDLIIRSSIGQSSTGISILEPSMEANLSSESVNDGVRFSEYASLVGVSLHRVNRVAVTGFNGIEYVSSTSFQLHGTTGLSFIVPRGTINGHPVVAEQQTGYYSMGNWYGTVFQSVQTQDNLKVLSPFVNSISTGAARYQDSVTVSGGRVENCKVLFSGYNSNQIEATTLSTGFNSIQVSVPRGVVGGRLTISGNSPSTVGTEASSSYFYPIPTITGLSSTSWSVGDQVEIEAINAAQARPLVSVKGYDYLMSPVEGAGVYGTYFVSTPSTYTSNSVTYFGQASVDNSSLLDSLSTGVSKITATVNARMVGSGSVFLVSKEEGGSFSPETFYDKIVHFPFYQDQVSITGKQPQVLGLSSPRAAKSDQISISGTYLMTANKLTLAGGGETKSITSGQFLDSTAGAHQKIDFYSTGNENYYNQTQLIKVNLSDFNFQGSNGTFTFSTPSF